jgi:type I restriction enzyme, S subunit
MNNEAKGLLEKHFDLAFSAPNGVQKLRELILTFAMQGKLVPQDPNDQPASELLKQISTEKQRLVKEGIIKQQQLPPIKPQEVSYKLPEGWEWVRLGEITNYNGRRNINSEEIESDTWLLDLEDIEKDTSRVIYRAKYSERQSKSTKSTFKEGDVLYGKLRPYLDKVVVADTDGICTTEIVPIVPLGGIDSQFLRWLLKRPLFLDHVNALMYGVKMPRLGTQDAVMSIHQLPPLNEQRRIVAKIDRLMAQCDELENLGGDRNQKRITIHTAAIDRLLAAQADSDFSTAWDFIQQHFGELYSVKENVAELRKAILQLAVMGKLVPQDPNDEPASELLKAISASKNRLVLQGKVKEPKSLPEIRSEEIQYQLPEKWEWVRLGKITNIVRGGSPRPAGDPEFYDGDIPFLKVADLTATDEMYLKTSTYSIKEAGLRKTRLVPPDTLMLTNSGATLGIPKICTFETTFNDGIAAFIYMDKNLDKPFFYYVLSSRTQWFLDVASRGQGQPNLNTDIIGETPVALPPLAEQRRIVTKIGQLMTLCNELEQQIDAATDKRTELLKALMAQV